MVAHHSVSTLPAAASLMICCLVYPAWPSARLSFC